MVDWMASVVKIGGKSCAGAGQLEKLAETLGGWDGNVVAVVSAQGDTTNRIEAALKSTMNGGAPAQPEEIFKEFDAVYRSLGDSRLSGIRDVAYSEFRKLGKELASDDAYTAILHLCGERLSAAALNAYLDAAGMHARWLDFTDGNFPLSVKGDYHSARIDFHASRKKAAELSFEKVLVLPGYGGVDGKHMKTLGRGGSDTAAFGCLYAFGAKDVWILTNVNGILDIDSPEAPAKTVPELDLHETVDAAALGAKLPGSRALEGVLKCFGEGGHPGIYIANSGDICGAKTRIMQETEDAAPVKLVAGRDVVAYDISGDVRGVQNALEQTGVEFNFSCAPFYGSLLVPVDAAGQTDSVLNRLFEGRANGVRLEKSGAYSWIGAIGKGMEHEYGITARAGRALSATGVDIIYNRDPGRVSVGFVVPAEDKRKSLDALYAEFLGKEKSYYRELRYK